LLTLDTVSPGIPEVCGYTEKETIIDFPELWK